MITFAEEIYILHVDHHKWKSLVAIDDITFDYSLIATVLCELIYLKKIKIADNKIEILTTVQTGNTILDTMLINLEEANEEFRSLKRIFKILTEYATPIKNLILGELLAKNILKKDDNEIFFGFCEVNYPIPDETIMFVEERIRKLILDNHCEINHRDAILLKLICENNLIDRVVTQSEYKEYKSRIMQIIHQEKIGNEIISILEEIKTYFF